MSHAWLICKVNRDISEIPLDSVMIGTTEIIGIALTEDDAATFRAQNHPAISVQVPLLSLFKRVQRVFSPLLMEGEMCLNTDTGDISIATLNPEAPDVWFAPEDLDALLHKVAPETVFAPNVPEGEQVMDMSTGKIVTTTRDPFAAPDPQGALRPVSGDEVLEGALMRAQEKINKSATGEYLKKHPKIIHTSLKGATPVVIIEKETDK